MATTNLKDELKSKKTNKVNETTTDRTASRRATGQNAANQTLTNFDYLTDNLADRLTDNLAAQVELKVSKQLASGEFTQKVENRVIERLFGYCEALENNYQLLEAEVEALDSPLALPSVSDSSFREIKPEDQN